MKIDAESVPGGPGSIISRPRNNSEIIVCLTLRATRREDLAKLEHIFKNLCKDESEWCEIQRGRIQ